MGDLASYRSDRHAFTILKAYTLISAVLASMEVLRLVGVFNIAELNKLNVIILGVPCVMLLLIKAYARRLRVPLLSLALAALILNGLLFGVGYQNNGYYIAADTVSVIFSLFILLLFSSVSFDSESLYRYLVWASWILLVFSIGGVLLSYVAVFVFGKAIYFSFGSVSLLIPFAFYLVYRRWLYFIPTALTILLAGKVGVMLSAVVITLFVLLHGRKGLTLKFVTAILVVGLVMVMVKTDALSGDHSGVFGKLQSYSYSSYKDKSAGDITDFGGGRFAEVYFSIRKFLALPGVPLLSGGGFGFVYDSYYLGVFKEDVHNVHISAVTILVRHGLLLAVFFYFAFMVFFLQGFKLVFRDSGVKELRVLYLFVLGSFVFSFTAFNVFATLFNWFFIGLLFSAYRHKS